MAVFVINFFQDVKSDWVSQVGRVKIDDVFDAMLGDKINQRLSAIAVGIEKGQSPAFFNILNGHVF